jgi:hypothetical protein
MVTLRYLSIWWAVAPRILPAVRTSGSLFPLSFAQKKQPISIAECFGVIPANEGDGVVAFIFGRSYGLAVWPFFPIVEEQVSLPHVSCFLYEVPELVLRHRELETHVPIQVHVTLWSLVVKRVLVFIRRPHKEYTPGDLNNLQEFAWFSYNLASFLAKAIVLLGIRALEF